VRWKDRAERRQEPATPAYLFAAAKRLAYGAPAHAVLRIRTATATKPLPHRSA